MAAPLASTSRNHSLAGTALDLLVRATLQHGAITHSAAEIGAGMIVVGSGIPPAMDIEREAVTLVDALEPWRGHLDGAGCRRLAATPWLTATTSSPSKQHLKLDRPPPAPAKRADAHRLLERLAGQQLTLQDARAQFVEICEAVAPRERRGL